MLCGPPPRSSRRSGPQGLDRCSSKPGPPRSRGAVSTHLDVLAVGLHLEVARELTGGRMTARRTARALEPTVTPHAPGNPAASAGWPLIGAALALVAYIV